MESSVVFVVGISTAVVLMVIVVLANSLVLLRKRRQLALRDKELAQRKIDDLIRKNEVESVNALLKGQNSERRRISQELHDRLGGILFTAKIYHNSTIKRIEKADKEEEESFYKLKGLLDDAVKEVRRVSHDLYAGSLANFGYSAAIRQLISAIEEANDIEVRLTVSEAVDKQPVEIQHELHALTQEMLSNTLKHAKASKVEIEVQIDPDLILSYRDNGVGFDKSKDFKGIGLKNIENRVRKLNGNLHLESGEKRGTYYLVTIPVTK